MAISPTSPAATSAPPPSTTHLDARQRRASYEGAATMPALIVGRDITGIGAFA